MAKKLNNLIATRILKYRGIIQGVTDFNGNVINIECFSCGKKFKPSKKNLELYMFGHKNCTGVYVKPVLKFERQFYES